MHLRLLRATALAAALGWAAMPAGAQTGAQTEKDPVVARVDGAEITRSDLVAAQQALPEQYRLVPLKTIFQPLLRQLINTKPFAAAAFALKPGEITPRRVKTQFGWHAIKTVERRAGSAPSFEESRAKMNAEMTRRVIAEGLDGAAPAPSRIRRVQ